MRKGFLFTGTSNIVVPGSRQSYPLAFQGKSRLNYYSSFFNSLEINSSFYKVPMPSTFEKWVLDVPEKFTFTVKLWKGITHVKELDVDLNHIDHFLHAASRLGKKKGCILVQFPGKITIDNYEAVENILKRINKYETVNHWRIAVEFRNATWYAGETMELMDEYNASIVLHDIPKSKNMEVNKKAEFIFFRFHGPQGDYRGSYSDESLKDYAYKIKCFLEMGKDVFAYFNNTIGNAFENACTLQKMVSGA